MPGGKKEATVVEDVRTSRCTERSSEVFNHSWMVLGLLE